MKDLDSFENLLENIWEQVKEERLRELKKLKIVDKTFKVNFNDYLPGNTRSFLFETEYEKIIINISKLEISGEFEIYIYNAEKDIKRETFNKD